MKRSLKNVIMIITIIIMLGLMVLTMNYAKNNITNVSDKNIPNMNNNEMPPSMQENSNEEKPSVDKNQETGDNTKEESEKPEPPEKPSGEDNSSNQIPNNGMPEMNNNQNSITWVYYLVFAVEGLVTSTLFVYLIMSRFNKRSFKETFANKDKMIINVLSIIILTFCFTCLDVMVTKKYFLQNNNSIPSMNNNQTSANYSAKEKITENKNITTGDYESTTADENAILVTESIAVNISNININKTGDSDGGDNTSFYGTNSAIIAKDGATLTIKNISVETNATGANGVFSYGGSATTNNSTSDGTTIIISDSKITTTKDNSGGIMTTGGGIMKASNLTINTAGTSSAAIRTDRGGGTVTVDGGTYKTTGKGSPTIYSTANITVNNANLVAEASEGVVIEGKNSVTLNGVTLTDTNTTLNGQSTTYKNIFLYQSMSGDADTGIATFTAKNSNIITNKGDTLYITNTKATIELENNTLTNNDSAGNFLRAQKDSWGTNGSNGGEVTLVMKNQKAIGNIVIDSLSTLNMSMKTNSYYEGTINSNNTAKALQLNLDKSSKIKLTGDSYVTSFTNEDTTNSNIDFNNYKLYVNGIAIN